MHYAIAQTCLGAAQLVCYRVHDFWGVRRTGPQFWATSDWLQADFRRREPTAAGVLDLDRYDNL